MRSISETLPGTESSQMRTEIETTCFEREGEIVSSITHRLCNRESQSKFLEKLYLIEKQDLQYIRETKRNISTQ